MAMPEDVPHLYHATTGLYCGHKASKVTSHIPDEVLSCVFKHYKELHVDALFAGPVEQSFTQYQALSCGMLELSTVCHHWRSIALENPDLWTAIACVAGATPQALRTVLLRSRGLPLSVHIHYSMQAWKEGTLSMDQIRRILKSEAHRILHLSVVQVKSYDPLLGNSLSGLLAYGAVLESLDVRVLNACLLPGYRIYGPSARRDLPNALCMVPGFDKHPSKLRKLVLAGHCEHQWDNPLFSSSITHLDVDVDISLASRALLYAQDFLRALGSMKSLEYLKLRSALPRTLDVQPSSALRLELPSTLRCMIVRDSLQGLSALLTNVSVPAHTAVHLAIDSRGTHLPPPPIEQVAFWLGVSALLEHSTQPMVLQTFESRTAIRDSFDRSADDDGDDGDDEDDTRGFTCRWAFDPPASSPRLIVDFPRRIAHQWKVHQLLPADAARTATVLGPDASCLLRDWVTLALTVEASPAALAGVAKSLEIAGSHASLRSLTFVGPHDPPISGADIDVLLNGLRARRRQRRAGLESVSFVDCQNLTRRDVRCLKEVVDEVLLEGSAIRMPHIVHAVVGSKWTK